MATVTTDFTAPFKPRTRAERSSEGVIATYIRSLAQMVQPEHEHVEQVRQVGQVGQVDDTEKAEPAGRCGGRSRRRTRISLLADVR